MIQNGSIRRQIAVASVLVAFPLLGGAFASAAVLSGSFSELPRGSNVNLTAAGPLDWVHWGLYTDTSIDRKEGVPQQIGDYVVIGPTNDFLAAYQYGDNWNSYSWSDGAPTASQTNTTTGIWAYGFPENMGSGFELTAPADPTIKTLEVYVGAFDARGRFEARLSDSSAPGYTNAALVNLGNGPSG